MEKNRNFYTNNNLNFAKLKWNADGTVQFGSRRFSTVYALMDHIARQQDNDSDKKWNKYIHPEGEFCWLNKTLKREKINILDEDSNNGSSGGNFIKLSKLVIDDKTRNDALLTSKTKRQKHDGKLGDCFLITKQLLPETINLDVNEAKKHISMEMRKELLQKHLDIVQNQYPDNVIYFAGIHDEKGLDLHIVMSAFDNKEKKYIKFKGNGLQQIKDDELDLCQNLKKLGLKFQAGPKRKDKFKGISDINAYRAIKENEKQDLVKQLFEQRKQNFDLPVLKQHEKTLKSVGELIQAKLDNLPPDATKYDADLVEKQTWRKELGLERYEKMIDYDLAYYECEKQVNILQYKSKHSDNPSINVFNKYTHVVNEYKFDFKTKSINYVEKSKTEFYRDLHFLNSKKSDYHKKPEKIKEFNGVELNIPNLGFKINISSDALLKTYANPEIIEFCKDLAEKRGLEISEVLEINANSRSDKEFYEKIDEATKDHGRLPEQGNEFERDR